ncbi:MAG: hypothetical protein K6C30_05350 [Bacteroidaceae bacterium]|nr:hypothetical protein [Bacteroidaceae bacterium]
MKQRILSLLAMIFLMLGSAVAQTWTAPVAPETPDVKGVELESGSSYYIRNVGAGQYMVGANSWATQISISETPTPNLKVKLTQVNNSWLETEDPNYPAQGWEMSLDGDHFFTGDHNRKDYKVPSGKKLFRDSDESGFVDLGSQNRGFIWTITKNESGNYFIQTIAGDPNYPNAIDEYAGVAAGTEPGAPVVMNLALDTENNWIEWEFIPTNLFSDYDAAVAIYKARLVLYQYLVDATTYGADTEAAGAVYNNADATVEEINAAAEALRPEVRKAILAYASKNATAENTIDLTNYVLENPAFDTGDLSGWTISAGGGNRQYQGASYEDAETGVKIQGFIETWVAAPNCLANGSASQKVGGLPDGHYILECDGMALNQTSEDSEYYVEKEDYKGAYLFYSNGAITVKSEPLASNRGVKENEEGNLVDTWLPTHFTFGFDVTGADTISVGFLTDDANINWLAADNWKLIAAGAVQAPPAYTALLTEVAAADAVLAQRDDVAAQTAAYDALAQALEEVTPLIEAAASFDKVAEYEAAYTKLNAARVEVHASIEAYAKIEGFIDLLMDTNEQYTDNETYKPLCDKLDELLEKMENAQQEQNLSAAEINSDIDGFDEMVKQTVKEIFESIAAQGKELDSPLDITSLFDNMSFAYGTSQVAFAGGYPAENPVWMNETGTGNFKTNYSTGEVWNVRPFNIYRDFAGLPKGKYTIQTHAFYRVEANAANYENYNAGAYEGMEYAYVYAGSNKSPLVNNAALACDIFSGLTSPYDCGDGNYLPNSQLNAYEIFTKEEYAEQAEMALVEASSVVTEDGGTLRVGIAGTDQLLDNQWTIWYGWKLFYHGVSSSALAEELAKLIEEVSMLDAWGVEEGAQMMDEALTAGEKALSADEEAMNDAISKLKAVIEYVKKSEELANIIYNLPITYQDMMAELADYQFTDTEFTALLKEVQDANANSQYSSNAQIEKWIADLKALWPNYILSRADLADATVENPVDMSMLISNASFDNNDKSGWDVTCESNGGKEREGIAEFWNCSAWDLSQELPKLKDGYWRLECDALFRAGNSDDEISALKTKRDSVLFNEEYLYVKSENIDIETKVVQWSNTEKGAVVDNEENAALLELLSGKTLYEVTYDTETLNFYSANNQSALLGFFENGRYHNALTFSYSEAEGPVRIGLKLKEAFTNCWCPFDNFKLNYLGTEAPVGVENLETEKTAMATSAIYGVDGRRQNRLSRGINIVRTADGKVRKVLVK